MGSIRRKISYSGYYTAQKFSLQKLPAALTGVYQGLLLFFLLACDTLVNYEWRRRAPVAAMSG